MAEDKEEVVEPTPLIQILAHKVEKTAELKSGATDDPPSDYKEL